MNMKKLISLALAMVMMLAMAVPAFADQTKQHTITIEGSAAGHQYTAYKIFAGDISGGVLTNITWGDGVDGDALLAALKSNEAYADCETAEDVAHVLKTFNDDSAQLDAFAKIADDHLATAAGVSTESAAPYTIKVTGDGYYLVKDTGTIADDDVATKNILQVLGDVKIEAKSDKPTVDKVIVEADTNNGLGTAQDVGSVVNFKVTSKVPQMDGYETYTYIFTDTMSAGLTPYDEDGDGKVDVTVTIGGEAYTDFTVAQTDNTFTVTFNNFIKQKENAGEEVVITYGAVINEGALSTDKETNTVKLTYSNDPNDTTKVTTTPDKTVYVYEFDIVIDKYGDGDETSKLDGAKFVLRKEGTNQYYYYNETTQKVEWVTLADSAEATIAAAVAAGKITEVTTDKNGAAKFQGLDSGKYELVETAAPAGYNKLTGPVKVEITATYNENGTLKSTNAIPTNNGQYELEAKIENKSGTQLPSTGGMGTTMLYAAGSLMVAAAVVLLIVKRRMNAAE